MSQVTTLDQCAYCPGPREAIGTIVDRLGETVSVCTECLLLVWDHDWAGFERKVWDYQLGDATRLEVLRGGIHARRVARRWTRGVRRLSTGATDREKAQAVRRRVVRGWVHTLTLRPEQRPGDHRDAFVAATWRRWITGWILRPTSKKEARRG